MKKKVLFRVPFTVYFLAYDPSVKLFSLAKKEFGDRGYYWNYL